MHYTIRQGVFCIFDANRLLTLPAFFFLVIKTIEIFKSALAFLLFKSDSMAFDPSTGFMLLATSLVMLMTPGLAFFYGGLVGKNVLTIMAQSFVSLGWRWKIPLPQQHLHNNTIQQSDTFATVHGLSNDVCNNNSCFDNRCLCR